MIVGVPRCARRNEHRAGLNPFAVSQLVQRGHTVLVESRAGEGACFLDQDYEQAGGRVVYGADEVSGRADLICRVDMLDMADMEHLKPGAVICGFQHLAVASRDVVNRLMDSRATVIGYEIIRDRRGDKPVLMPSSEIAGRMAVHLAAFYLQNESGGRGVLLGNVPAVPPPTVLVLGAGAAGRAAAAQALASGAHVIVLDADIDKLRRLNQEFSGRAVTVMAADERLEQYTAIADVVIGAVAIPGGRAPFIVTEPMVRAMKAGSVIIDISIDQGGCVETSRPTSLESPTFMLHDVLHYCVPNLTANVARTSSRALANAALPYLLHLADNELEEALRRDFRLALGVYLYRGQMVNEQTGKTLGIDTIPLDEAMARSGNS